MLKRVCRKCGSTENEFKKHSGCTKKGTCKPCHNKYLREYFARKKDKNENERN